MLLLKTVEETKPTKDQAREGKEATEYKRILPNEAKLNGK
jgi:hypothetical protein